MATVTTQDRKIAEKLNQVDVGLQAAYKAIQEITEKDIRSSSYADGISLFKEVSGAIFAAQSKRKRINYFAPGR